MVRGRWLPPQSCTCIGALHLRNSSECQDASDSRTFLSLDNYPVSTMVVADGHGGKPYFLSDKGSAIACTTTFALIKQYISTHIIKTKRNLMLEHAWFSTDLPKQIHLQWLVQIENHWREYHSDAGDFDPKVYGTTLGIVLMTPFWWGHTGIGDWDLTISSNNGSISLLSEEKDSAAPGEATFSLCHTYGYKFFANRTKIYSLFKSNESFSIALSTDGIRKSCSTDKDFLLLSSFLSKASTPFLGVANNIDLPTALKKITTEGCGDDVSVAVATWCLEKLGLEALKLKCYFIIKKVFFQCLGKKILYS
jgi:Protein phosphatase 2C